MAISYTKAVSFTFRKGPFEGKSIEDIAKTDRGLKYLDSMREYLPEGTYGGDCLTVFFAEGDTEKQLEEVMAASRHPGDWRADAG